MVNKCYRISIPNFHDVWYYYYEQCHTWITSQKQHWRQAIFSIVLATLTVTLLIILAVFENIYTKILISATIVYMQTFIILAQCFQAPTPSTTSILS
jgi:hypothetical protein